MSKMNIDALRQSIASVENGSGVQSLKSDINNTLENAHVDADINKISEKTLNTHNLDEIKKCYRRITILVNYRERCSEELRERLVERENFDVEVFNAALKKAQAYNLVNDARYAEMYAFCKTQSYKGVYGVKQHLKRMKIDYSLMPKVLEILNSANAREEINAKEYISRHSSAAQDQFAGNVRKLVNRGFSVYIAIKAAKAYQEEQMHFNM